MSGEDEKADFDIFSHIAGADAENFEAAKRNYYYWNDRRSI